MKRLDIALILAYIAIAIGLAFLPFNVDGMGQLRVVVDGEILYSSPMSLLSNGSYTLRADETTFQFEIENEKVRIKQMTREECPRQICSKTGWVKGEKPIVCLPNKIVIEIVSKNDGESVDGISY